MKTKLTTLGLSLLLIATLHADPTTANNLYQQGRTAFYGGDHTTAQALLEQTLQLNPQHIPARALLKQIKARAEANPGRALKAQLAPVVIPKIELEDVELKAALDFLSKAVAHQTGGKAKPNFVLQGITEAERPITLKLNNVPFDDALTYITQLAKAKYRYEKHAIVLTPAL